MDNITSGMIFQNTDLEITGKDDHSVCIVTVVTACCCFLFSISILVNPLLHLSGRRWGVLYLLFLGKQRYTSSLTFHDEYTRNRLREQHLEYYLDAWRGLQGMMHGARCPMRASNTAAACMVVGKENHI